MEINLKKLSQYILTFFVVFLFLLFFSFRFNKFGLYADLDEVIIRYNRNNGFFESPPYCDTLKSSYRIRYFSNYSNIFTSNLPISPVPPEKEFQYFNKKESLNLVKYKTILFFGDSTSRRIANSFCHFLVNPNQDLNVKDKDFSVCLEEEVLKANVILQSEEPVLILSHVIRVLNKDMKKNLELHYLKYSKSKVKDSLHFFVQLFPLHIKFPCYESYYIERCGYDVFFKTEISKQLTSGEFTMTNLACATIVNFVVRANEEYNKIIKINKTLSQVNLQVHGMTNIPRMIDFQEPRPEQNDMQFILAKALYSISYETDMCKSYFHFLPEITHASNLTLSFIDQTTWALGGSHWREKNSYKLDLVQIPLLETEKFYPDRQQCLVGDIHIKKSEGQRLRVISFLNTFLELE